jgi:PIN domain nuclease of toxin-antitoxin system
VVATTSIAQANSIPIGPFHAHWHMAQHHYHCDPIERVVAALAIASKIE